jgi:O-methyltransferase involved in polyketide biosynthesis
MRSARRAVVLPPGVRRDLATPTAGSGCGAAGLDVNVEALTFHEPDRSDAAGWLTGHGWQVHSVNNRDEMARLGRPVPEDLTDEAVRSTLLRARLGSI